jgi:hypothetical protein
VMTVMTIATMVATMVVAAKPCARLNENAPEGNLRGVVMSGSEPTHLSPSQAPISVFPARPGSRFIRSGSI